MKSILLIAFVLMAALAVFVAADCAFYPETADEACECPSGFRSIQTVLGGYCCRAVIE
jgi:hypothetical protein